MMPRPKRLSQTSLDRAYARLCRRLGSQARGKIAAIDANTGASYIGETIGDALEAAGRANPSGYFVVRRVGYRAVYRQKHAA